MDAFDTDGSVAKVEFYVDGEKLGEDTSAPFEWLWNNVYYGGDFTLTAVATDNAGGQTSSPDVHISVLGNHRPIVSITSPADGSAIVVPSTITITADAIDPDGSVTNLAFYANGSLLTNEVAGPYAFDWTNAPLGDYVLEAVATDNEGLSMTSAPVVVALVNTPPPQELIVWGDEWRYLDDGSNQGAAWQGVKFR